MEREREWALRRPLITGDKLIAAAERTNERRAGQSVRVRIWRPNPDKLGMEYRDGN